MYSPDRSGSLSGATVASMGAEPATRWDSGSVGSCERRGLRPGFIHQHWVDRAGANVLTRIPPPRRGSSPVFRRTKSPPASPLARAEIRYRPARRPTGVLTAAMVGGRRVPLAANRGSDAEDSCYRERVSFNCPGQLNLPFQQRHRLPLGAPCRLNRILFIERGATPIFPAPMRIDPCITQRRRVCRMSSSSWLSAELIPELGIQWALPL
jgi:hypothetical protein